MPNCDVFGLPIFYQRQGCGEPLLLLHCGLGTGGDFAALVPDLVDRYTVLTPDRPGYGRSAHGFPFDGSYFSGQADTMDRFLEALGIPAALVWGWSDGGVIALWMAIRHPERVRAVVVEAGHFRGRKPDEAFIAQHLEPTTLPPEEQARLVRQHGPAYWQELSRRWAGFWLDQGRRDEQLYAGRLGEVRAPTLILHAADDIHVTIAEAAALQAGVATARLIVFPDGGHTLHAGPARARVLAAARAFLEEVAAGCGSAVAGADPRLVLREASEGAGEGATPPAAFIEKGIER